MNPAPPMKSRTAPRSIFRRWPLAAALPALLIGCGGDELPGNAPQGDVAPSVPATSTSPMTTAVFEPLGASSGLPSGTWGRASDPAAIVEVKGGGFALLHLDDDGVLDVFLPGGRSLDPGEPGRSAQVFRGTGAGFSEVPDAVNWQGWAMGAAVGDLTGDGLDDVLVTAHGPNALFVNQGDGTLVEDAAARGLDHKDWSMAAALGDFDNDGDLDLYIANYLELDLDNLPPDTSFQDEPIFAGPLGLTPTADLLFENRGDGTFANKSFRSGILNVPASFGLAAMPADFDVDGDLDVFVGNDSMANFLFLNDGGLRFSDAASQKGLAANGDGRRQATMGVALGDFNGDALPDVFTTNFASDTNTLQVSRAGRPWRDRTSVSGLTTAGQTQVGWASLLGDFDLDGDDDLAVFNGHVYPERLATKMGSEAAQPALYFEREGQRFMARTADEVGAWLDSKHIDRGGALADFDQDGDLDLFVQEWRGPLRVLVNQARESGASAPVLEVELRQATSDRYALGARVELVAGDTARTAWIAPAMGFQSSGARTASFTLADTEGQLSLRVTWPDGQTQEVPVPAGTTGRMVVERE